jgi:hypothetical protein
LLLRVPQVGASAQSDRSGGTEQHKSRHSAGADRGVSELEAFRV